MLLAVVLVGVLSMAPWGAEGYSSGAPDAACTTMIPNHGGQSPQTSQPPFQLTPGGVSVDGGTKMTVTLSTVSPTGGFKGFLLQARDANTDQPLGTFVSDKFKYLTCGNGFNVSDKYICRGIANINI